MPKPSIILAEDHAIVRKGFRALIEQETDYEIVAETSDGLEAVDLVREKAPRVLVVDLRLPSLDGLEVTRQVKKQNPETHVIILSMHADEAYVVRALQYGASAYVLKDAGTEDLVTAIQEVSKGRKFFSEGVSNEMIEAYSKGKVKAVEDRYDMLTAREREVLHLLAEGFTGPEVAEKLFVSPRTVDTHRSNIVAKLGLRNQAELVRYAVQRGLLPETPSSRQQDAKK